MSRWAFDHMMNVLASLSVQAVRANNRFAPFSCLINSAARRIYCGAITERRTMSSGGGGGGKGPEEGEPNKGYFFLSAKHAALYAAYRPQPPLQLLQRIAKHSSSTNDLLDVGCGSGQSTEPMAPLFRRIVGLDLSAAQIEQAEKSKAKLGLTNIEYRTGCAYPLPFEPSSFDAVTGSQCVHWFDLDQFYPEACRVLRSGGILAMYGYCLPLPKTGTPSLDKQAEERITHFYAVETRDCWEVDRTLIDTCYRTLPRPKENFSLVEHDEHIIDVKPSSLDTYISYISSWSLWRKYRQLYPDKEDPLAKLRENLANIYGVKPGEDRSLNVETNFFLLVYRKK